MNTLQDTEARGLRILLVQGSPLLCLGMRSVLERHGMQIVGSSTEQEEILALVAATRPDVVLLDGTLTFDDGYREYSAAWMVAQMRLSGGRGIFVLVPEVNEESLFQFLVAGVAAYERDSLSADDLVQKVRQVALGEYLITSEALQPKALPFYQKREQSERAIQKTQPLQPRIVTLPVPQCRDLSEITVREIEVLQCMMEGLTNVQIGKVLRITDQTVKNHITHLLCKLSVQDRTAAVVAAIRLGLLKLSAYREPGSEGPMQLHEKGANLSVREKEVLNCVMRGWTNNKIGRMLKISTHTVQIHMTSVKSKLQAQDRTEAVVTALRLRLIERADASTVSKQ
jgi:DNA-binding NarL/FixJ family response regulator